MGDAGGRGLLRVNARSGRKNVESMELNWLEHPEGDVDWGQIIVLHRNAITHQIGWRYRGNGHGDEVVETIEQYTAIESAGLERTKTQPVTCQGNVGVGVRGTELW